MGKQVKIYNGWRVDDRVTLKSNHREYFIVEIEVNDLKPARFLLDDGIEYKEVGEFDMVKKVS